MIIIKSNVQIVIPFNFDKSSSTALTRGRGCGLGRNIDKTVNEYYAFMQKNTTIVRIRTIVSKNFTHAFTPSERNSFKYSSANEIPR